MSNNFDFSSFSSFDKQGLENKVLTEQKPTTKKSIWEKMFSKNKLKKPRMVAVLFLRNNGKAEPLELEVKNGFFEIAGKSYHEDKDCMWRFTKEGLPLAIIEQDSLLPIGTRRYYQYYPDETSLQFVKRKLMECQDHVLRGIRHAEFVRMGEKEKSGVSMKQIIVVGIILIVIYALWKGGTFG